MTTRRRVLPVAPNYLKDAVKTVANVTTPTHRKTMNKNNILNNFMDLIDEVKDTRSQESVDVKKILTESQYRQFVKMERVITNLFTSGDLHTGIRKTIAGPELTKTQQINVLIMLKIFETFINMMNETGALVPDNTQDTDLWRLYN